MSLIDSAGILTAFLCREVGLRSALMQSDEHIFHWHIHHGSNPFGKQARLIVTALTHASGRERHRHKHVDMFCHPHLLSFFAHPLPQTQSEGCVSLIFDTHQEQMIGRVMTVSHESKGMLDGQVGPMDAQHHIVIDADQRQAGESHGTHST